jgi:hypothetical protein
MLMIPCKLEALEGDLFTRRHLAGRLNLCPKSRDVMMTVGIIEASRCRVHFGTAESLTTF